MLGKQIRFLSQLEETITEMAALYLLLSVSALCGAPTAGYKTMASVQHDERKARERQNVLAAAAVPDESMSVEAELAGRTRTENLPAFEPPFGFADSNNDFPLRPQSLKELIDSCREKSRMIATLVAVRGRDILVQGLEKNWNVVKALTGYIKPMLGRIYSSEDKVPAWDLVAAEHEAAISANETCQSCIRRHAGFCITKDVALAAPVAEWINWHNGWTRRAPEDSRYSTMWVFNKGDSLGTYLWQGAGTLLSGCQLQVFFAFRVADEGADAPPRAPVSPACRFDYYKVDVNAPASIFTLNPTTAKTRRLELAIPHMVTSYSAAKDLALAGGDCNDFRCTTVTVIPLSKFRFKVVGYELPSVRDATTAVVRVGGGDAENKFKKRPHDHDEKHFNEGADKDEFDAFTNAFRAGLRLASERPSRRSRRSVEGSDSEQAAGPVAPAPEAKAKAGRVPVAAGLGGGAGPGPDADADGDVLAEPSSSSSSECAGGEDGGEGGDGDVDMGRDVVDPDEGVPELCAAGPRPWIYGAVAPPPFFEIYRMLKIMAGSL